MLRAVPRTKDYGCYRKDSQSKIRCGLCFENPPVTDFSPNVKNPVDRESEAWYNTNLTAYEINIFAVNRAFSRAAGGIQT